MSRNETGSYLEIPQHPYSPRGIVFFIQQRRGNRQRPRGTGNPIATTVEEETETKLEAMIKKITSNQEAEPQ